MYVRRPSLLGGGLFFEKEFKGYKDRSSVYSEPAQLTPPPPKVDVQEKVAEMPKIEINLDDFFDKQTDAEKKAAEKAAAAEKKKAERKEAAAREEA